MGADRTTLPKKLPRVLMGSIVGAALRSGHAITYFDAAAGVFRKLGRDEDATAIASMRDLYVMGEIEMLMMLRAQWLGKC